MFELKKYINNIEFFSMSEFPPSSNLVHIALAFDDNYAMPVGVTITSVIENNDGLHFCFHLLVDKVFITNIVKLKELVQHDVSIKIY